MGAIARTPVDGVYERAAQPPLAAGRLGRWTVYVLYPFDPAAAALDVDALAGVEGSIEEIDVNALDEDDAREIAKLALAEDYEPGGIILSADERIGWYL